ncbi:MAG: lysylphosphatidylglycerol synthase transmembrane domain-containing protein [Atribacterota bacterium]
MERMEQTLNPRKILRQSLLGVGGSIGALTIIVLSLFRQEEEIPLSLPAPHYLLFGVLLLVLAWSCDAVRVSVTTRLWKKRIRFRDGLTVVLSGYFLSGITPANTGGNVAEIYVLVKSGLSLGEATSLTLVGGALYSLSLVILFSLFSLFFSEDVPSRIFQLALYLLILYVILVGILALFLCFPKSLVLLTERVSAFLSARIPRLAHLADSAPIFVGNFLGDLREKFLLFLRNPHYLGWNIAMYCLHFVCLFATTYCILQALAASNLSLLSVVRLQIPLFFALRFTPLPGASGVAELSFASLFGSFLEGGRVSLLVFFWRLYTYYGALGAGSIALFRTLAR